jgi:hypothetical protein
MNRYQPSTRRPASVIAAIALTALTLGASVVAPIMLDPSFHETGAPANPGVITTASAPDVVNLGRIEVRACAPESAMVQVRNVQPRNNQPRRSAT